MVLRGVSTRGSMGGLCRIEASLSQICRAAGMAGELKRKQKGRCKGFLCVRFPIVGPRAGKYAKGTV